MKLVKPKGKITPPQSSPDRVNYIPTVVQRSLTAVVILGFAIAAIAGIRMITDKPDVLPVSPPTIKVELINTVYGNVYWQQNADSSWRMGDMVYLDADLNIESGPTPFNTKWIVIGRWVVPGSPYTK